MWDKQHLSFGRIHVLGSVWGETNSMQTETGVAQPHQLSSLESELNNALRPLDDLGRIRELMAKMGAMQPPTKAVFTSFPACNSNA